MSQFDTGCGGWGWGVVVKGGGEAEIKRGLESDSAEARFSKQALPL